MPVLIEVEDGEGCEALAAPPPRRTWMKVEWRGAPRSTLPPYPP